MLLPLRLLEARELWRGSERAREAGEVIALLAKQPGPVACEDLSLCYWAGKGFEIDFFLAGQKLEQGFIDPRVVTERLRDRLLRSDPDHGERWEQQPVAPGHQSRDRGRLQSGADGSEGAVLAPRRP